MLGKDLSGDQLFHPAGAVSHLDVQDALVAVHGEHEQLFARNAPFHTGDVFRFRVHHRACFFAFQIKYLDLDLGIFLAGLWVFELVGIRVQLTVHGHAKFANVALVEAHESEVAAIGRPEHAVVVTEFLLVYPIRGTVDNGVDFTVVGNLGFLHGHQLDDEHIVVTHECNVRCIGREGCQSLSTSLEICQRGARLRPRFIDMEIGSKRVPVNGLYIGGQEDVTLIC